MITEQSPRATENEVRVTVGHLSHVSSVVAPANPEGKTTSAVFTRKEFEGALDKVSRLERTPERA